MVRLVPIALLSFLFSTEVFPQQPWYILARPTTRDLNKLYFLDSLKGWVVGDSGTIVRTTNGGQTWFFQESRTPFDIVSIFMLNENFGWALAHNYHYPDTRLFGTTMLYTTNGGVQWSRRIYTGDFFTTMYFFDSLNGVMGGVRPSPRVPLVWTSDGGATWNPAAVDSTAYSHFPVLKVKFYSRTYGYAVGGQMDVFGVVWKTTDAGLSWESLAVGPEPVHDIHYIDSVRVMGIGGDLDFGSGRVMTTNAGQTWEYTYLGIWGEARALAFRTPYEVWSPLGFPGTYMSSFDSGQTWSDQYSPDSTAMFDAVFTDSLTGYMVGKRGTILKYVPPPVNVNDRSLAGPPETNILHQNFPNPFNPRTAIRYAVQSAGFTSLKIFNLLGQEVAVLVEELQLPGEYEVTFESSTLPSGVYFYRLRTGTYAETKKLLLLR